MWLLHVSNEVHMKSREPHGPAHNMLWQHELAAAGVHHLEHQQSCQSN